jgi:hypothetical protein
MLCRRTTSRSTNAAEQNNIRWLFQQELTTAVCMTLCTTDSVLQTVRHSNHYALTTLRRDTKARARLPIPVPSL